MHRPPQTHPRAPRLAAHRGASAHALENSLQAMHLACSLGADGAEFDVHATADGGFVVHHDAALPGIGPIASLPLAEVRRCVLADGSQPPTLTEVLQALPGLEAWVEVKGLDPRWDADFLRVLQSATTPRLVAVHAFDHRIVARLRTRAPSLAVGVLQASYPLDPLAALRTVGAAALWQHWELIDEPLVRGAHALGAEVVAWTVPLAEVCRLAALGVDVLCVNAPDAARAALSFPRPSPEI